MTGLSSFFRMNWPTPRCDVTDRVDPEVEPPPLASPVSPQLWLVVAVVAAGGVIGAELRWGVSKLLPVSPDFPWATIAVNVVAGLGVGVLMATLRRYEITAPLLRPFIGTGIMGGLSTFSTYSSDTFLLIDHGRAAEALGYAVLTLVAALAATLLGTVLVAFFAPL
jgi:CrcB protein